LVGFAACSDPLSVCREFPFTWSLEDVGCKSF